MEYENSFLTYIKNKNLDLKDDNDSNIIHKISGMYSVSVIH